MENGIINIDSDKGRELGFTSDKFSPGSYMWKQDGAVIISLIQSRKKGNFRELVDKIRSSGLTVKVPTPLANMERIVRKCGYRHTIERDPMMGPVEVWVLDGGNDGQKD